MNILIRDVPGKVHAILTKLAKREDRSLNKFLVRLLKKYTEDKK